MSKRSRTFFQKLKEGGKALLRDLVDESARFVRQGSAEMSSSIFQGHAYVPYGAGQYPTKDGKKPGKQGEDGPAKAQAKQEPEHDRGQERGGRES
jgi:hypothetical protein